MATPAHILHLSTVASTQDEARARFGGEPVLVTAERQTEGRGRSGAGWQNADRALAASLALAPDWAETELPRLTLVAGLAAHDITGVGLKWPNDLTVDGRKIGGILTERREGAVVIGMGVNLWWPEPPAGMGSLHREDPGPGEGPSLAEAWAGRLLDRVAAGPSKWGRDEYAAVCVTLGSEITWEPDGRGRAVSVEMDGGLVVETARGTEIIHSGSVREVRPAT